MAAYRRVYDSYHLEADCQERDHLQNPALGNRVWAMKLFAVKGDRWSPSADAIGKHTVYGEVIDWTETFAKHGDV